MGEVTRVTPLEGGELTARWQAASRFITVGSIATVAGGAIAAATGPLELAHGSWLAAYLVLVGGVAQIVLGAGQAWVAQREPPTRLLAAQLWLWNLGAVAVLGGTLGSQPALTTVGGAASSVALALFVHGSRPLRPGTRRVAAVHRVLAGVVAVSVPVGIVLAWMRHG